MLTCIKQNIIIISTKIEWPSMKRAEVNVQRSHYWWQQIINKLRDSANEVESARPIVFDNTFPNVKPKRLEFLLRQHSWSFNVRIQFHIANYTKRHCARDAYEWWLIVSKKCLKVCKRNEKYMEWSNEETNQTICFAVEKDKIPIWILILPFGSRYHVLSG